MTMFICERGDIVIIFRKMFGRTTSVIRLIYNYSTVLLSDCILHEYVLIDIFLYQINQVLSGIRVTSLM